MTGPRKVEEYENLFSLPPDKTDGIKELKDAERNMADDLLTDLPLLRNSSTNSFSLLTSEPALISPADIFEPISQATTTKTPRQISMSFKFDTFLPMSNAYRAEAKCIWQTVGQMKRNFFTTWKSFNNSQSFIKFLLLLHQRRRRWTIYSRWRAIAEETNEKRQAEMDSETRMSIAYTLEGKSLYRAAFANSVGLNKQNLQHYVSRI